MADDLGWRISDDKKLMAIKFDRLEYELSADAIRDLIIFLSFRRAEMLPAPPQSVQACHPADIWVADSFEIKDHPETQTAQISLRLPGIGWSQMEFHPDDCETLSALLARARPAARKASH